MANLLTSRLLAAIDWDEYQRDGRELPPSTVDWIKANGEPNIEFEFKAVQKAVEWEEKMERYERGFLVFKRKKGGFTMNRIKELRKQKNLSLEQLSDKLKESGEYLSTSSLSKYERGVRNPKIENWVKLAKFFDVSVAYLKGEKRREDKR